MLLKPFICAGFLNVSSHQAPKKPANIQNLPRLPVPKLQDTIDKYLKSVKPFLNHEEFHRTTKIVKEFLSGPGQKLQDLLMTRSKDHMNWLEDWWLNTAYLEYRDPVVVFSSPGLVYPFQKFRGQHEQLRYAARTLNAAMDYKSLIDRFEELFGGGLGRYSGRRTTLRVREGAVPVFCRAGLLPYALRPRVDVVHVDGRRRRRGEKL